MTLENSTNDDSQRIQAPRDSGGKKSRRSFLASTAATTAGVVGFSAVGSAAATGEHTLVIEGFDTNTTYSFTVGNNLQKSTAEGASVSSSDEIVGESAHGAVGGGRDDKDAYTFDGPLHAFDFDRSGEINVTLDGEAAHVGNRPDHVLSIEGFGSSTSYSFTAGDNLQKSTIGGASINSSDDIVAQSAHGAVGGGKDTYTFEGPLYAFDFDSSGEINVMLDGKAAHVGNRPDHVLLIEGFGPTTSYSFSTTKFPFKSEAYGASINSSDTNTALGASGAVEDGKDAYVYKGRLRAFDFDRSGELRVTIDGKAAHVGNRPDRLLRLFANGEYSPYEFSVSDSLREAKGVESQQDTIDGTSASGAVSGYGNDQYAFDGELTSLSFPGENAPHVYSNGKRVSPSDV